LKRATACVERVRTWKSSQHKILPTAAIFGHAQTGALHMLHKMGFMQHMSMARSLVLPLDEVCSALPAGNATAKRTESRLAAMSKYVAEKG
jgi:hypothetical protein